MRTKIIAFSAASALVMAAVPAIADHNSKNGEGTANMPNDIHNTRVETKEANDNEAFRDFVKYGEGSKVPNRYESDETTATQAQAKDGNANSSQRQQQPRDGETKMVQEKKMDQVRDNAPDDKASDRSVRNQSNRTSMNTNRTSTQRSTGRRGGGGDRGGRK